MVEPCVDVIVANDGDEYLDVETRDVIVEIGPGSWEQRKITFVRLCRTSLVVQICIEGSFDVGSGGDGGAFAKRCAIASAQKLGLQGSIAALDEEVALLNAMQQWRHDHHNESPFHSENLRNMKIRLMLAPTAGSCGPWVPLDKV